MIIIFDKLEPGVRGSANGMELHGKKEYDGSAYKKFYFDTTQDGEETALHKAAKALKAGDRVDLEFDTSKYKNLKGIKLAGDAPAQTKGSGGGGGYKGGGGKGNFRNPDHTDRSSAMYLAWEIVAGMNGIKDKAPQAKVQKSIMAQFEDMSQRLTTFVQTGKFPNGEGAEAPADKPAPADTAGDDIPF